jgi:hypothetical protein
MGQMSTNWDEEYKKTIKDAEKNVSEPRVIRPSSQMLQLNMIQVFSPCSQILLTQFQRR